MKRETSNLYEKYHKNTLAQQKFLPDNNFTHYYSFRIIREYLKKNSMVLEIGCGAGANCFYAVSKGAKITGIDISSMAIDSCIKSAENLKITNQTEFIKGDFSDLLLKKKYDLIICYEVLEHIKDDIGALEKISSLLAKGGKALISVPSSNSVFFKLGLSKNFDSTVGHLRRYNEKIIREKCNKSRLTIIKFIKVEGLIRDLLFQTKSLNFLIRFFKFFTSDIINLVDQFFAVLIGESRLILVVEKKK